MAIVTIKLGTYNSKVECLVVEKLAGYPLVLGNPWLMSHQADMAFPRRQVVLQKPDGKEICLNAFEQRTQTATEKEKNLSILGDAPLLPQQLTF
jgi:hypothetical protein